MGKQPTQILGKSKRELLTRIREYRTMFPDELKTFKVKEGASEHELEQALTEIDVIVSCSSLQKFCDEAILAGIGVVETISSRTTMLDITGTSDALRANPEFARLCRLIYLKHRVFNNMPCEYQLAMVVASTAMMCRQNNLKKKQVRSMLQTPI